MSETVDQILNALRRCRSVVEVNETAKRYKTAVDVISADPNLSVRATHIKNLAAYMRSDLMKKSRV